jgi:hypothetical protein
VGAEARVRLTEAERIVAFGPACDTRHHVPVTTPWGITVPCHRLVVSRFVAACQLAHSASSWRPARIDGYACRRVRGGRSTSLHAWALAWDWFDAAHPGDVWGPRHAPPPAFARAFTRLGFTWGGDWFLRKDWPHIEWAGPPPDQHEAFKRRVPKMILVHPENEPGVYLVFGRGNWVPIEDPGDRDRIVQAGVPYIDVRPETWQAWRAS